MSAFDILTRMYCVGFDAAECAATLRDLAVELELALDDFPEIIEPDPEPKP